MKEHHWSSVLLLRTVIAILRTGVVGALTHSPRERLINPASTLAETPGRAKSTCMAVCQLRANCKGAVTCQLAVDGCWLLAAAFALCGIAGRRVHRRETTVGDDFR